MTVRSTSATPTSALAPSGGDGLCMDLNPVVGRFESGPVRSFSQMTTAIPATIIAAMIAIQIVTQSHVGTGMERGRLGVA